MHYLVDACLIAILLHGRARNRHLVSTDTWAVDQWNGIGNTDVKIITNWLEAARLECVRNSSGHVNVTLCTTNLVYTCYTQLT